jgi:uncharacterized protein YkwD
MKWGLGGLVDARWRGSIDGSCGVPSSSFASLQGLTCFDAGPAPARHRHRHVLSREFQMSSLSVPTSARRAAVRARTLATVSCLASATALLASLSACGGGGADAPPPPPPPPAPSPAPSPATPIAAQMTVPTPVGYDAERLAAFNRLNEIRLSAGLGMVAQNALLDQAAQAHADWMIANDSFVHTETSGTPGFTGADWWNRDEVLGYVPVGGSEGMSSGVDPAAGVDELVNGVYHRAGLLAFEPVDVGVGWSSNAGANVRRPLVVDVTRPGTDTVRGVGQAAQVRSKGAVIWPLDQSTGVPTHLGLEIPNPVPAQDVLTLGSPASVTVDRLQTIQVTSFAMINVLTGAEVSTALLTNQNDPNSMIPQSFAAIVPVAALGINTSYRVVFKGTAVAFPSGDVVGIDRTWSFTTASQ